MPRQPLLIFLAFCGLLLAGCAPTRDAITAPDLGSRLTTTQPIRLLTPLATVYTQRDDQTVPEVDRGQSQALTETIQTGVAAALGERGWQVAPLAATAWHGLAAGTELAAIPGPEGTEPAAAAGRLLRQLDDLGRHLRDNERIDGVRNVSRQVDPADCALLAPQGGSLLIAVAVGCDGRLDQGPCRDIQSPPIQKLRGGFGTFTTTPAGMALHLYWVSAKGWLLWYDTTRAFNAVSSYPPSVKAVIAETLAEFPPPR